MLVVKTNPAKVYALLDIVLGGPTGVVVYRGSRAHVHFVGRRCPRVLAISPRSYGRFIGAGDRRNKTSTILRITKTRSAFGLT